MFKIAHNYIDEWLPARGVTLDAIVLSGVPASMKTFVTTTISKEHSVQIVLKSGFGEGDWEPFETYYRAQVAKGFPYWDLDLRHLTRVNSLLLGLLVGMNSEVAAAGGRLRLIVAKDSTVNQLLTIAKLRRLMMVVTV